MATQLPQQTTSTCALCFDDTTSKTYPVLDGQSVCGLCAESYMVPKFHAALDKEFLRQSMWGENSLEPDDFILLLGADFIVEWHKRTKEYLTPPKERMYCTHRVTVEGKGKTDGDQEQANDVCGRFLGTKISVAEGARHGSIRQCPDCKGDVCPDETDSQDTEDKALAGLKRGRDYQSCPSCRTNIELQSGCNSMRCHNKYCRTGFCFICGACVDEEGDRLHWTRAGGCPKFGKIGENPLFETANGEGFLEDGDGNRGEIEDDFEDDDFEDDEFEDEEIDHIVDLIDIPIVGEDELWMRDPNNTGPVLIVTEFRFPIDEFLIDKQTMREAE